MRGRRSRFRNTFVNLCPTGATPGRSRAWGRREVASARPRHVVRAAREGVRQPLLAWHAPALLLGAADPRGQMQILGYLNGGFGEVESWKIEVRQNELRRAELQAL